jgi:nicotinate-nucleotide pyrophosphorylase (carboxylating)
MNSLSTIAFTQQTQNDAKKLIEMALQEDIGSPQIVTGVDCTTQAIVPAQATAVAAFVTREAGVVCGLEVCKLAIQTHATFLELICHCSDGDTVKKNETIAELSGSAHQILFMERTCLNFLCRLSGISSLTNRFVREINGTQARVFDTRKTAPGWRRLEKYAVKCGGGENHRMGLYDAIMIKDNHLAFYRSLVENSNETIPKVVKRSREWIQNNQSRLPNGSATVLQLEVDTLEQFEIALECMPDILLLDNMTPAQMRTAVKMRNKTAPKVILEASGGVNLRTIKKIALTGVERISIGALTHSAPNFDIGLDWRLE